jgi:hypothetical protein
MDCISSTLEITPSIDGTVVKVDDLATYVVRLHADGNTVNASDSRHGHQHALFSATPRLFGCLSCEF